MKILLIILIFIMSCSASVESEYFQGSNEEYEIYLDIFTLVNLGRFLDASGEDALCLTIAKFENRFAKVEMELKGCGSSMENSTLEEMDEIWNEIKKGE